MLVKSKKNFQVIVDNVSKITFSQFCELFVSSCDQHVEGFGDLICRNINNGLLSIKWSVSLAILKLQECQKLANQTVHDEVSFAAWINTIVEHGKDSTNGTLDLKMPDQAKPAEQAKTEIAIKTHVLNQEAAQRAGLSNQNTSTDTSQALDFNPCNVLMNIILREHKANVKYKKKLSVYVHPTNQNRYGPLNGRAVQIWAQALVSLLSLLHFNFLFKVMKLK
jgi:hypothetical protein